METLFVGKNIIKLSNVDSTNNYATQLLRQSVIDEGDVVITSNQTSGKGQRGNSWQSDPDLNLTFSVLLKPTFLNIRHQFYLTKAVSIAIANLLVKKNIKDVSIKWPNDIYVGQKKIAGILIESNILSNRINSSIVGVGLNVNQSEFSDDINATSLINETKRSWILKELLADICYSIEVNYLKLRGNHLCFDKVYLERLKDRNIRRYFLINNKRVEGMILGINKLGQLQVDFNGRELEFNMKEIAFID